jgi:hypothetical protein
MKRIPTSTYKMSKQLKTLLAGTHDVTDKSIFKALMIQAELEPRQKPKQKTETEAEKAE